MRVTNSTLTSAIAEMCERARMHALYGSGEVAHAYREAVRLVSFASPAVRACENEWTDYGATSMGSRDDYVADTWGGAKQW